MTKPDPYALKTSGDDRAARQEQQLASLSGHPYLRGLSPQHLKVLAQNAMPVEFPAGELIFREGDNANRFYLIEEGEVALEAHDGEGGTTIIDTIGAGDVLGWSWMFPPYYWRFDARATRPTKAMFFYGTRLREECEQDPKLGFALATKAAEVAIRRLQATRKKLLENSPKS